MFRMIIGTLVALYCVLLIFGDESRRPAEVAREEAPLLEFDFASWIAPASVETSTLPASPATVVAGSAISAGDAIEQALATGKAIRDKRKSEYSLDTMATVIETPEAEVETASEAVTATVEPPEPELDELVAAVETPEPETMLDTTVWYVTGSTVNVRSGPGTDNPVVTQVQLGDAAEVLGQFAGWVEIKPAGTDQVGWISGRFLQPEAPG